MAGELITLQLGEVCDVKQGRYLGPGDMSVTKNGQTPIPVIGANGILGYTNKATYNDKVTLVTCRGSNCGMLQRTIGPTWISNNAMACVPKEGTDSRYIYYVLKEANFRDVITGSAQPQITTGHLNSKVVVINPDVKEQKRIAGILGALDDKIELNRKMNETLEQMAKALFKSWFVDFDPVHAKAAGRQPVGMDKTTADLFPISFLESELGKIPKGWKIVPVGEAVECVGGATPSTAETKYWEEGRHHWTTPKDFSALASPFLLDTERKLTDAGISKISSGLLPAGTLLLSSRAPIGYIAIATIPVAINQGFIALKCNEIASNFFMLNWCKANMAEIEGRATGTTFPEISKQNFRPISVCLPPKELMSAFTTKVSPIYGKIVANLRQSRNLSAIRDTLLPRLLNGDIVTSTKP
jgi:type I restriction enzyme S subunit